MNLHSFTTFPFRRFACAALAFACTVALTTHARAESAATQPQPMKRVLFFSKSAKYEHAVIKRVGGQLSFAERILEAEGPKRGIAFTFSKDGSLFSTEYLAQFDAISFYTTGDLFAEGDDKQPPMTPAGKDALLAAVRGGKGFVGMHSASDTFHTGEVHATNNGQGNPWRYKNNGDKADPFVRMLGAEFIAHDAQQSAKSLVVDGKFPGTQGLEATFDLREEWYSLADFSTDMHVILVLDTAGMSGPNYQRPPFPSTWARMHGKGRVFYTSLGHREDVWTNPLFQNLLFGGIAWAVRNVEADVAPNLAKTAPGALTLQPIPPPKPPAAPAAPTTPAPVAPQKTP